MPGVEVTVIIPVRNGAHLISAQLEALAGQDFEGSWETVVADNGSTDDITTVVARYEGRLPGLRRVDAGDRIGVSHARNAGARAAKGDYLLFVDADDVVAPGYLSAMRRALQTASLVAATHTFAASPARPGLVPQAGPDELISVYGFWPSAGGPVGLRKRDFESIGGFDEDFLAGEDIDFSWRAHLASLSLERAPDALIEIRAVTGARQSFRKGRFYGLAGPQLFRRYRVHGMARRRGLTLLRFYGGAVIRLAQIRNRDDLHAWLLLAGYRAGLIEGSLRERVLYL